MVFNTNSWYKFKAFDISNYPNNIIVDGYLVTGEINNNDNSQITISAIYDKNDVIANLLNTNGGRIGSNTGNLVSVHLTINDYPQLNGGEANSTNYARFTKSNQTSSECIKYTLTLLNKNQFISKIQQKLLNNISSNSQENPMEMQSKIIPQIFLSPGCVVDVNNREIDFTNCKTVEFRDNVNVTLSDGSQQEDVFNYLISEVRNLHKLIYTLTGENSTNN